MVQRNVMKFTNNLMRLCPLEKYESIVGELKLTMMECEATLC
jgi:hypothetical protein